VSEAFVDKLRRIQRECGSNLALQVAPRLSRLPMPIQRYDDPFLPFGKAVIQATRDLVCAYGFDFPAYLAIGAAGAIALERTIAYAGKEVITILDGSFGPAVYLALMDETAFNADAITMLNDEFPIVRNDKAVFVFETNKLQTAGKPTYYQLEGLLTIEDLRVQLVREDVLYLSSGENFAEPIRAELLRRRSG
jgi:hypothetical protein